MEICPPAAQSDTDQQNLRGFAVLAIASLHVGRETEIVEQVTLLLSSFSGIALSRLNRACSGPYGVKDTTFVLDFVNDGDEILQAFQVCYETATLEGVTDPDLIYDMRAKLDATGYYDEPEVDRVAAVEVNPKSRQRDLQAAIFPVADRLVRRFKAAKQKWIEAEERNDQRGKEEAKLVYVNNVLKGKLLESEVLTQQASTNTKEQFANSPDLAHEILNAIMDAYSAHTSLSRQALDSEKVRNGLKDALLGPHSSMKVCDSRFRSASSLHNSAEAIYKPHQVGLLTSAVGPIRK